MEKKSKDKHTGQHLAETARKLRDFAKVYNNHKVCPLMHDLLRVLYPGDGVKDKRRALNEQIREILHVVFKRWRLVAALFA